VGGLLSICPVMDVEPDGSLAVKEKIRTKHKAVDRVIDLMRSLARDGMAYDGKVFISNSECLPDAQAVGGKIEGLFHKMDGSVEYFPIGATIGTHTGPGTVALFYWGARRA
ncbi:MAG: DegV family protein, partial [Atopobiaceae bacterium]|nr:DegV family protein [Atopobiaceae bacterium]